MTQVIGFAGTFYTLWTVSSERVDVALGAWYNKTTYTYHRNLSKDKDEAIAKSGTNKIDETLRGKRKSFHKKTNLVLEPEVMTERERLFMIVYRNDIENTIDVKKRSLARMLELGYVKVIEGIYVFQGELRFNDKFYHDELGVHMEGII